MMNIHYVYNFVSNFGLYELDYYNPDTLDQLNNFIYENIDYSYWSRGDMVRVSLTENEDSNWYDIRGLYFWNGSALIYPFYNGKINSFGTTEYEIDSQISNSGYIPNIFQFAHEFHPADAFSNSDGINDCKILFSNLSSFSEVYNSDGKYYLSNNYDSTGYATVYKFEHNSINYHVFILGEDNYQIQEYFSSNRPYEFDISQVCSEYDISLSPDEIRSAFGLGYYDQLMFIHPRFLNTSFENTVCESDCIVSRIQNSRRKTNYSSSGYVLSRDYTSKPNKKSDSCNKSRCIGSTSKGHPCTRMAKSGHSYCGIHLRSQQESQPIPDELRCQCITAKGSRCVREIKNGYDYCAIHLSVYN